MSWDQKKALKLRRKGGVSILEILTMTEWLGLGWSLYKSIIHSEIIRFLRQSYWCEGNSEIKSLMVEILIDVTIHHSWTMLSERSSL